MSDHEEINTDNLITHVHDGCDLIRSIGKEKTLALPDMLKLMDQMRQLEHYRDWTDDEILEEVGKHILVVPVAVY